MHSFLCERLAVHGRLVRRPDGTSQLDFDVGSALLRNEAGALRVELASRGEVDLFYLRVMLADHIIEQAGEELRFTWSGLGSETAAPPNFRLMTVREVTPLAPHMRRLTLVGKALGWFDSDDLHVRLLIPPRDVEPEWPRLAETGRVIWPQGAAKPAIRKYTIRRIDVAAGEVDIDFVVHADDAGPGSDFATAARRGDILGMTGPGGGGFRPAGWNLLAGDETALPAIARILESLPADARGLAFVEVQDENEELPIRTPAGMEVRWLHRGKAAPGTTDLLLDAVRGVDWPDKDRYAWVGCEFQAFKQIRSYLRKDRGLGRDEHLAVAYWRRGENEDSFSVTKHRH
ncbi:siderophore-interacting protein [Rhizobium sp. TRM95111]|uniref:siderophore-interacting protein n=1 Tax=Rhizobium alarense TaxID=2846851 RepID=UPI001F31BA90|nr:siderophore-interacting protein [Rhizobium alarense]MCF3639299.1 siderophore-interacting protein [Rhizobium alarense]